MILLGRNYRGYAAGSIVQLPTSTEAALVAAGYATVNAGPVTPGNIATDMNMGRISIAAAGTSAVLTSPWITAESKVFAQLQGAIDTTAKTVNVTCAAGANGAPGTATFTVAAATAAVTIDWCVFTQSGELPPT